MVISQGTPSVSAHPKPMASGRSLQDRGELQVPRTPEAPRCHHGWGPIFDVVRMGSDGQWTQNVSLLKKHVVIA